MHSCLHRTGFIRAVLHVISRDQKSTVVRVAVSSVCAESGCSITKILKPVVERMAMFLLKTSGHYPYYVTGYLYESVRFPLETVERER